MITITRKLKLHIKNMVCDRCIMAVRSELEKLGHQVISVELGTAELRDTLTGEAQEKIAERFAKIGFELAGDRQSRLVARIKALVVELVHHSAGSPRINLSDQLSRNIGLEYNYLSNLFSAAEGTTIEKYYIAQRIERVKELLAYGELSVSEIADSLGYSSAAYLSAQFRSVTGMTPGQYRKGPMKRNTLDDL